MPILSPFLLTLSLGGQAQPVPAPKPVVAPVAAARLGVVKTLKVGGEGGWDYVTLDAEAGRLYVPRSSRVLVLDLDGKLVGEIPNTQGVHGVALARELDRGFTSNGRSNTMTVFKLSTLEVVKEVKTTGENPDAILYEPATRQVFTFNGRGQNATVFSADTLEVKGTLPMGGKPEFPAGDGQGRVFVNVEDTAELLAIDARSLKVEARWSLKPLEDPTGLALDAANQRLFSVGGNRLMGVVDARTGKLLTTLPIGAGCDGAAFDPATGNAYASNGEGTLTVIHGDKGTYTVVGTIPTKKGARTMAVDGKGHRVFLPTAEFGPAPEAKPGQRSRAPMLPDTFQILVVGETR
jgi:DNA-binding beta-propeller fold protein YncE